MEYYKQNMPENFKLILDEGSDESTFNRALDVLCSAAAGTKAMCE